MRLLDLRPFPASLLLLCCVTTSASAHLSVIRQGPESGGNAEVGNNYGQAVAAGDFNGDGFEDLATGAPDDGQGDPTPGLHGALTVNFGSPYGLTHVDAQYITIGNLPDVVVRFGWSLAAGNFNNDAYDDLAVGAPDLDRLGTTSTGAVLIYMGGPLGLPNTASLVIEQEDIGEVGEANDRWGWSVCSGDFNGDGFDDLGVGAIGEDSETGMVSAVYGSAAGIVTAGAQSFRLAQLGGNGFTGSHLGWAVATGNVMDTAHEELIVSAPDEEVLAVLAGRVYVIRGSGAGLDVGGTVSVDGSIAGSGISTPGPNEFGYSLAVGEFQHGSPAYLELVIGEPGHDAPGMSSTGRVVAGSVAASAQDSSWVELTKSTAGGLPPATDDRFGTAVAAGRYRDIAYEYDQVAVSAPGDDPNILGVTYFDAGQVYVFDTFPNGLGTSPRSLFNSVDLNDKDFEASSQIGQSLTFGFFDDFERANLVVGATLKDFDVWVGDQGPSLADAGQVYVVAPWRQVQRMKSRTAIAVNCDGDIVFSQRPFTPAPIASLTKTMTGLLTCEAVAAGFDTSQVHVAPAWAENRVPCNCWPFVEGQRTAFMDLLRITMGKSSNDAAFSLADMLTGPLTWSGLDSTASDFVDDMNARAAALGMFGTLYSNPAGHDVTHYALGLRPYSTAYDQTLLARAAMQTPCLANLVATNRWVVPTFYPAGSFLNIDILVARQLTNVFKTAFDDLHPDGVGIKGGLTNAAKRTAMYAVRNTQAGMGHVTGAAFGFETASERYAIGARLMNLALTRCADGDSVPLPPPPPPDDPIVIFPEISTCDTIVTGVNASLLEGEYNPAVITVVPGTVNHYPVDLTLLMFRQTTFAVGPGEVVGVSTNRFKLSEGFIVTNVGEDLAELTLFRGVPINVNLQPGESYELPGAASIQEQSESFSLQNTHAARTNLIEIRMRRRGLPMTLIDAAGREDVALGRTGDPISDDLDLYVQGMDPECTNTVSISINAGPPATTHTGPRPPSGVALARWLGSYPNPAVAGTTLQFELLRPAAVLLEVFDLSGRRVRTLIRDSIRAAGEHHEYWDGRDDAGVPLSAGAYFVRLDAGGARDSGRIVITN